jgi:hypothetical protein
MFKLLASAFTSLGMIVGGLFGGHQQQGPAAAPMQTGSTSPSHMMGSTSPQWMDHNNMGSTTAMHMMPAVAGIVESINGTTLTVTGIGHMPTMGDTHATTPMPAMHMGTTTYTVDASNAKILEKGTSTATISAVKTGDRVIVMGSMQGTSVTATSIIDGITSAIFNGMGNYSNGMRTSHGSSTPPQTPAPVSQ